MSLNKRELIFARLEAIIKALPDNPFVTVVRNRDLLDQEHRPACVILDGDESVKTSGLGRGRRRMSPVIVTMRPEIYILLKGKLPKNKDVGQSLNDLRNKVVKAIAADAELFVLIGSNGDMSYDGCETDLKSGMPLSGEMLVRIGLQTAVDPYN